jgi:hypothetical protein
MFKMSAVHFQENPKRTSFGGLALVASAAFALTASVAVAAPSGVIFDSHTKMVSVVQRGGQFTPQLNVKPKAPKIYNNFANFAKYPKGPYWAFEGYAVSGPSGPFGTQVSIGAPFTPMVSATATGVEVAAAWQPGEGANGVVVGIYSDSSGVPGTELWTGNADNLQDVGACCAITHLNIKHGLALTGGTQYWVVLSTSDQESATLDVWLLNEIDQVDPATIATNTGSGWSTSTAMPGPAFAILGK